MKRTITIDSETITLKATNLTPFIYKRHFKKDFLQELSKAFNGIPNHLDINNADDRKQIAENINTTFFYELVWTLAKTENKKIPKMQEWIGHLPKVAILELAVDASDLVVPLVKSTTRGLKR